MRRREVIALLSGAATWPVAVCAQSSRKLPRIGFFSVVVRERNQQMIAAFVDSLRELGFVENQDLDFVYRSADGHLEFAKLAAAARLPAFYAFRDHVDAGGDLCTL
jgi:putative ABC transport system substrate-binding protein